MAHDRMLRASMRSSEKVNSWPIPLRYFWTQLWGYCDDYGRGRRDARLIWADLFPLDEEVSVKTVERWMVALEQSGVVSPYEVAGKRYFECVNWGEHQSPQYLKKTDIPDSFGNVPKNYGKVLKGSESSRPREGEIEGEDKGKAQSAALSPFCPKHPSGTTTSCKACGVARLAFEASQLAERTKPTPVPRYDRAKFCPDHEDYPLPCELCARLGVAS